MLLSTLLEGLLTVAELKAHLDPNINSLVRSGGCAGPVPKMLVAGRLREFSFSAFAKGDSAVVTLLLGLGPVVFLCAKSANVVASPDFTSPKPAGAVKGPNLFPWA